MKQYDAIVIGAGPAGSTAALLLARAGWSVAIVEKTAFPRRKLCGEFISAPTLALLARAGLAEEILERAGPEVREVAVYAGDRAPTGAMPAAQGLFPYGRALGREHLDAQLLAAARRAGVEVVQPGRVEGYEREGNAFTVRIREHAELRAHIIIAAHGSWDTGRLPVAGAASDLVAFKAHFRAGNLPPHRMPLVAFPGGYGGLVTSDGGRVSFSCCIARDALAACRAQTPGASAGDSVLAHVLRSTLGMREAIGNGARDGAWLASGPLRPGIHSQCGGGFFTIGNAHGEAHPIVAEGISMAVQSACLLCERLVREGPGAEAGALDAVARDYERAYRGLFGMRIGAAAAFAALAARPVTASAVAGLLAKVPPLMSFGARWAGKAAVFPAEINPLQTATLSR